VIISKPIKSISIAMALIAAIFFATPAWAAIDMSNSILANVKCATGGAQTPTTIQGQNGPQAATAFVASGPCGLCDFIQVFVNASNMIVAVSGAVAILMFVYAGLMYLTVSFNPANLEKAKGTLKAVIIGLAFIFGGYSIMNFVILTLIGGTDKMNMLSKITGNVSGSAGWGVCQGYDTQAPSAAATGSTGSSEVPAGTVRPDGQIQAVTTFYKTDSLRANGDEKAQVSCLAVCTRLNTVSRSFNAVTSPSQPGYFNCSCEYTD
jgi:hypothetical protein